MKIVIVLTSLLLAYQGTSQPPCGDAITGLIKDIATDEPLPFATIKIMGTEKGAISDNSGYFEIQNICEKEVHLEVRYLGYKTLVHHHDRHHPSPVIYLAPSKTELESVIVENSPTGEIRSLAIQKKEIPKLATLSSSVGTLSGQFSGVSLLNTGSNISKPIIHGLHSNRVLVVNDGLRHAYQVWGQEHAPEIDPSHVDQIEIVKGAGTVKYGPDALGGVILYNSKIPAFDTKINGSLGSSYQTNGQSTSTQLRLGHGSHRFAWNVGAFGIRQGDLETPDYNLSNTGKRELGASFNALLHQPQFDLHLSGSYFQQDLGILRAAIVGNLDDLQNAIDRGIPNPAYPFTYDIQNPRQATEHGLLKADLSLFPGNHVFNFRYGIQQNIRKEFDVRRGELNDRPVIDLKLWSHNIEADWIQPSQGRWSGSSGVQYFTQHSENKPGSNPANFVPDYNVWNLGAFTVQSLNLDETTLELGARFDFQSLKVADTIRDDFTYTNEVHFSNGTFTLGMRKALDERLTVFSNIGSAWRPPNVAELYSFGYHFSRIQFGLWRYDFNPEIYTPVDSVFDETLRPVPSEKSIKWVSGLELKEKQKSAELVIYANQINDYIFLRPHGITVNVAGTFPYFIYDQTDALFLGADFDFRWKYFDRLSSEVKASYVYAIERGTRQAFLEIPPLNIQYTLDYQSEAWYYGLKFDYTAEQWNSPPVIEPGDITNESVDIDPNNDIFDFMQPPGAYFLIGGKIGYQKDHWKLEFNMDNLLNTPYRIYTDRLRYFADAPGRNFSIALEYSF